MTSRSTAFAGSFAQKLEQFDLQVDRIAGVHGRTASWDEFKRALQAAPGT